MPDPAPPPDIEIRRAVIATAFWEVMANDLVAAVRFTDAVMAQNADAKSRPDLLTTPYTALP